MKISQSGSIKSFAKLSCTNFPQQFKQTAPSRFRTISEDTKNVRNFDDKKKKHPFKQAHQILYIKKIRQKVKSVAFSEKNNHLAYQKHDQQNKHDFRLKSLEKQNQGFVKMISSMKINFERKTPHYLSPLKKTEANSQQKKNPLRVRKLHSDHAFSKKKSTKLKLRSSHQNQSKFKKNDKISPWSFQESESGFQSQLDLQKNL